MSRNMLLLETLECRTVPSTLGPAPGTLTLVVDEPAPAEVQLVTPPPGIGWLQAADQALENGFQGIENGNALGWLKHDSDGADRAPGIIHTPPAGSSKDHPIRKPSQEEMGPPIPAGYVAPVRAAQAHAQGDAALSALAGLGARPADPDAPAPVIPVAVEARLPLDEVDPSTAPNPAERDAADPSARPLERHEQSWENMPAWDDPELMLSFAPVDGFQPEATNEVLVLAAAPSAQVPFTDLAGAGAGLEQAIQGFLADLDSFARDAGHSLATTPAWVWVAVGAVGIGTIGLARMGRRPGPALAAYPSWVPGLPPSSSQKS